MGDFNTPLLDKEKKGGMPQDWYNKHYLSIFINGLAFLDLDLMGGDYTWSNKCLGLDYI